MGGVSGKIFGHDGYPEGHPIETPKVMSGTIQEGSTLETEDGATYKLGKPRMPLFGKPVPFTVEGVKEDTAKTLEANNIFSLYEKGLTNAPQDGNQLWASDKDGSNSYSLRFGNFHFDNEETGTFVFVPSSYEFETEQGFNEIMEGLGIRNPDLTFSFAENWGVVPNLDMKETEAYHRMRPAEFTENKQTWVSTPNVNIFTRKRHNTPRGPHAFSLPSLE